MFGLFFYITYVDRKGTERARIWGHRRNAENAIIRERGALVDDAGRLIFFPRDTDPVRF